MSTRPVPPVDSSQASAVDNRRSCLRGSSTRSWTASSRRDGGTGAPTAARQRATCGRICKRSSTRRFAVQGPRVLGTSCHDITVYPQIGLAGGACEGHGLLLDISDPAHPMRLDAASDSNFSYWHSATFNNDGTKLLFSDEWGGGGAPKCRASDPRDWGADAIFAIENRKLVFQSYYKLPAPQTQQENCVAHNGSLIPIPGRDVMVQAWYQGGISVFDWTDAKHPTEIAFFDRGPIDSTRMAAGGSWSAYWYNGYIVSSEIARGLDILELKPSVLLSQNEIDAAKTVHFDEFNTQGQPALVWPTTFVLAGAYVDQLERSKGLSSGQISTLRNGFPAPRRRVVRRGVMRSRSSPRSWTVMHKIRRTLQRSGSWRVPSAIWLRQQRPPRTNPGRGRCRIFGRQCAVLGDAHWRPTRAQVAMWF